MIDIKTAPTGLYVPDHNLPVDNLTAAVSAAGDGVNHVVPPSVVEGVDVVVGTSDIAVATPVERLHNALNLPPHFAVIAAVDEYLQLPCLNTEHSIARAKLAEAVAYLKTV